MGLRFGQIEIIHNSRKKKAGIKKQKKNQYNRKLRRTNKEEIPKVKFKGYM